MRDRAAGDVLFRAPRRRFGGLEERADVRNRQSPVSVRNAKPSNEQPTRDGRRSRFPRLGRRVAHVAERAPDW